MLSCDLKYQSTKAAVVAVPLASMMGMVTEVVVVVVVTCHSPTFSTSLPRKATLSLRNIHIIKMATLENVSLKVI